jgi:hypothetical protein
MRWSFSRALLALSLLTHGCLLDIAPNRERLDDLREKHMPAAEYGLLVRRQEGSVCWRRRDSVVARRSQCDTVRDRDN